MKLEEFNLEDAATFIFMILDTLDCKYPKSVPASALYAMVNENGCSLQLFNLIMNKITDMGFLNRNGAECTLGKRAISLVQQAAFAE